MSNLPPSLVSAMAQLITELDTYADQLRVAGHQADAVAFDDVSRAAWNLLADDAPEDFERTDTVRMARPLIDVDKLRPGKPAVPRSVTRDATSVEQVPGQLRVPGTESS